MGLRDRLTPPPGRYLTEVNKGSTNMLALTGTLNQRANEGWRLHTIYEQNGDTVMVFERPDA